jgi:hypothetical protein
LPRGRVSKVGDENTNALGYRQIKTADRGWIGKHIVILEKKLGRQLRHGERAIFSDSDKTNLHPDNIVLAGTKTQKSIQARIAKLQAEIEDRQAIIKELEEELNTDK